MSEWPPNTPASPRGSGWPVRPGATPPAAPPQAPPTPPVGTPPIGRAPGAPPPRWERIEGRHPFDEVVLRPPMAPPPADPSPEPPRRRRVGRYVAAGLGAAALVAGGVVGGLLLADDDGSAPVDGPVAVSVDDPAVETANEPEPAPEPRTAPSPIPVQPGPVADDAEEPVAAVAAAVAPAVVRIDTGFGTGSGIIYDESGLLVTNAHVVGEAGEVTVQLADGTRTLGEVLGRDPKVDVAVVRIDADLDFVVATFAPTSTVEVGQLAVAIGTPFGLEQSVTAGIISAVNQAITNTNVADGTSTVVEMIQTDAPINPGNSGGALADRQGRVVGVNTSIRTDGTTQGNLGVGFALPSDTVMLVADRIVNGESLESGFLGISGQDPTIGAPGALVTEVVPGGPAEAGGLIAGDLIVGIDGAPIPGMTELAARIRISSPGQSIEVDVMRDGEPVTVTVVLGALGES